MQGGAASFGSCALGWRPAIVPGAETLSSTRTCWLPVTSHLFASFLPAGHDYDSGAWLANSSPGLALTKRRLLCTVRRARAECCRAARPCESPASFTYETTVGGGASLIGLAKLGSVPVRPVRESVVPFACGFQLCRAQPKLAARAWALTAKQGIPTSQQKFLKSSALALPYTQARLSCFLETPQGTRRAVRPCPLPKSPPKSNCMKCPFRLLCDLPASGRIWCLCACNAIQPLHRPPLAAAPQTQRSCKNIK
jgi:hypothetical protein